MTLGGIHKQVNIQFTLSGGGGLACDRHLAHDRKSPHSQSRVTAVSATAYLLATGILNDLPGLTSCRCNNRAYVVDSLGLGITCLISLYSVYKASRSCLS